MKDLLIVEVPTFNDETVASIHSFLETFVKAFENHYCCQLERYYCRPRIARSKQEIDEIPF